MIAREQSAGIHLPYARHVDDVTLETRDGLLMQTIRLGGLLFETADTEELNYRAELRDAMLKAVGSSRFALYHHVVRSRADAALEARFPDEFSRNLDARWRERLAKREMYVNELFLTIGASSDAGQGRDIGSVCAIWRRERQLIVLQPSLPKNVRWMPQPRR